MYLRVDWRTPAFYSLLSMALLAVWRKPVTVPSQAALDTAERCTKTFVRFKIKMGASACDWLFSLPWKYFWQPLAAAADPLQCCGEPHGQALNTSSLCILHIVVSHGLEWCGAGQVAGRTGPQLLGCQRLVVTLAIWACETNQTHFHTPW